MKSFQPQDMTSFAAVDIDGSMAYKLVSGLVVPRPVAWISSQNEAGLVNVAPFSSFNYVAHSPAMLAVNIALQDDGTLKDTARNIRETGEFVVNITPTSALDAMNQSSAEYPADVSEARVLDIPLMPSTQVRPPRVAVSPAQMECRLTQIVPLGTGINTLYIAEIVAFHVANTVYDGRHIDSVALDPVARLGGPFYASLGEIHKRPRPKAV
ncbi:flavin reductase family protein [Neopusillimonas aromaticivorans]|uniref:flavin reductase family protein n=1 Tax=Neopusillimonas aromaticivorans TaxID=2979868 RepID=UPI0025955648|nr:flavin reductase family protein [Neopusillimonas aromaticivorans]WJJ92857.1 flavin reductase family protein [Neopusillimonas aromaticivorans]